MEALKQSVAAGLEMGRPAPPATGAAKRNGRRPGQGRRPQDQADSRAFQPLAAAKSSLTLFQFTMDQKAARNSARRFWYFR
ncbi:hypothetical protein D3C75_1331110 [compost metagenome]